LFIKGELKKTLLLPKKRFYLINLIEKSSTNQNKVVCHTLTVALPFYIKKRILRRQKKKKNYYGNSINYISPSKKKYQSSKKKKIL